MVHVELRAAFPGVNAVFITFLNYVSVSCDLQRGLVASLLPRKCLLTCSGFILRHVVFCVSMHCLSVVVHSWPFFLYLLRALSHAKTLYTYTIFQFLNHVFSELNKLQLN
jgi:hypothetical protein